MSPTGQALAEQLVAQVTIGETHFFRVTPQIEALRTVVLPDLIRSRSAMRQLAVWSAGCSTGEEPFTIAILLREQATSLADWSIDVLGTDVSQPSLDVARNAEYAAWSFRDTPEEIRERWFTKHGKMWQLSDAVRRMVRFDRQNLALDPVPMGLAGPRFDLIVCRNVLIYFSPLAVQQVYQRLADALAPGGWLILGPSDPPLERSIPLSPVYLHSAILWRRRDSHADPDVPTVPAHLEAPKPSSAVLLPPKQQSGRDGAKQAAVRAGTAPKAPTPDHATEPAERTPSRVEAQSRAAAQPLDLDAQNALGMLSLDAGYFEDSIRAFRGVIFLDSSYALAHFGLGRAYAHLGEIERARAALLQVRRLLIGVDDEPVRGADGLRVGDLRAAVEAQLAAFGEDPLRKPGA
jgi:chemotaxis protein methyltransferase CheR